MKLDRIDSEIALPTSPTWMAQSSRLLPAASPALITWGPGNSRGPNDLQILVGNPLVLDKPATAGLTGAIGAEVGAITALAVGNLDDDSLGTPDLAVALPNKIVFLLSRGNGTWTKSSTQITGTPQIQAMVVDNDQRSDLVYTDGSNTGQIVYLRKK